MVSLISHNLEMVERLADAFGKSINGLLSCDTRIIAKEFLTVERAVEQMEMFISEVNKFEKVDFKGKKLLEVGCGVGTFLIIARTKYGIEAFGIEPSEDEFSSFFEISNDLLSEYNLPRNTVIRGNAENLPFKNDSFDFIYSTNVLEHVYDPKKVLEESVRVLKKDGYLQFVIPNYFSFWEGHFGILWPCITNKFLAKCYAKITGQNPAYIDTLQLINPFYLKNILKEFEDKVEILSWGKSVFKNRLTSGNYSDWATLEKVRPLVQFIQKSKISNLLANILNTFEMYTPIVLTLRKKS